MVETDTQVELGDVAYRRGKTIGELGYDRLYRGMIIGVHGAYFRVEALMQVDDHPTLVLSTLDYNRRSRFCSVDGWGQLNKKLYHYIGADEKL